MPVSIGHFDADGDRRPDPDGGGSLHDFTRIWVAAELDSIDPAHDGPLVVGAVLPTGTRIEGGPGR